MSRELYEKAAEIQIDPTRKFVLVTLAFHADPDGVFRGKVERIERLCCASSSAVFSALRWLEKEGYLTRQTMTGISFEVTLHPEDWPGAE